MRVLIYHPFRHSVKPLQRMLQQHGVLVDTCEDEERFIYLSMVERYVAVLVVHRSSQESLVSCFGRWKSEGCRSLFMVLSSRQSAVERAWCLEAGIDHYFIEPYSYTSILEVITAQAYLRQSKEKSSLKTAFFELDIISRIAKCNQVYLHLTKKEFDLLAYFIRCRGNVLSRVQIWEEIWGYEEYPLGNIIDVHVNRLRSKLPEGYRHLIKTIYGIGYRMHELA